MRIVCPQCGYSRDIPGEKIPASSSMATCPKCQFRFRFRGHHAPSRPEESPEEPVYPPRPSRPVVESRPPSNVQAPIPHEPRTQRVYAPEPESEPDHYGHVPPRSQARWLPDPEPGFRPQAPETPARTPAAPFSRLGGPAVPEGPPPGFDPEPETGDERPAPWERAGARLNFEPVEDLAAQPAAGPAIERAAPPMPGEPRPDEPEDAGAPFESAPSVAGEDAPGDASQEVQPSEAVAGEDSVRDIWARLQAMGGEAKPAPSAPRQAEGEAPSAPAASYHPDNVAPWEQLEHYGVVPAFLNTIKNILLRPGDFFDQLPLMSGKLRPLLFALALCVAAMLFGLAWNYFGLGPNFSELGRTDGFQGLGSGAIGGLALLGLSPIVLIGFVFLDSALAHLLLGLLRSATKPFEETFRTVCYAGAPWILTALPVPWSYLIPVVLIWHMTLQAIGLKKLHQAGYPQVLASVLVKWSLYFMASFAILHVLITRR